jgi:hypothetical protein
VIKRLASRILKHEHGTPALSHEFERSRRPHIVQRIPQSVFVREAINESGGRSLSGGKHGQHGTTIAAWSARCSAEDALAILPQHQKIGIPIGAK